MIMLLHTLVWISSNIGCSNFLVNASCRIPWMCIFTSIKMNIWSSLYLSLIAWGWKNHNVYYNELKNCFCSRFQICSLLTSVCTLSAHIYVTVVVCAWEWSSVRIHFLPQTSNPMRISKLWCFRIVFICTSNWSEPISKVLLKCLVFFAK